MQVNSTSCSPVLQVSTNDSTWTNDITVIQGDPYWVRWNSNATPQSLQPAALYRNSTSPIDTSHRNSNWDNGQRQSWGQPDTLVYRYDVGGNCNQSKTAIVRVIKPADITRSHYDVWYFGGSVPSGCSSARTTLSTVQGQFHSTLSSAISEMHSYMRTVPAGSYSDQRTVGGRTIRVAYNVSVDKSWPEWCSGAPASPAIWEYSISSTWTGPERE